MRRSRETACCGRHHAEPEKTSQASETAAGPWSSRVLAFALAEAPARRTESSSDCCLDTLKAPRSLRELCGACDCAEA